MKVEFKQLITSSKEELFKMLKDVKIMGGFELLIINIIVLY